MTLTIFYDGSCPLCMAEMRELDKLDIDNRLKLEDLFQENFQRRFPHIDRQNAMQILHGQLEDGELLYGLEVTVRAWQLVGRKRWLRVLRWPLVKPLSDQVYLFFAKHRGKISHLLTGTTVCQPCSLQQKKDSTEQTKFDG